MPVSILVTGANGFVGHYIVRDLLNAGYEVYATGRGANRLPFTQTNFHYHSLDFTDPFQVHDLFELVKPAVVIHAGANGKPDECEQEQWQAFITNVEGTLNLLSNAEEIQSHFVFISTDFVFPGDKGPYSEEDIPSPVNYYGQTKLDAEDAVKEYPFSWAIVRTVLVYGQPLTGRSNLLTIVKDKLSQSQGYKVVTDQVRTPTYVEDLSDGILRIIQQSATGIYHLSGSETMTPFDMAIATAKHLELNENLLTPVTREAFVEIAKRPPVTGFIIDKAKTELGYSPRSFKEGLRLTFGPPIL